MYIGGTGKTGLHHLIWEWVDNSVDEAINGHATKIDVTLHANGESITVADNGRGILIDKPAGDARTALEIILTTLHAGGKFDNSNYMIVGGLHGVGSSVVNALSQVLIARIKRGGKRYEQRYERGIPVSALTEVESGV